VRRSSGRVGIGFGGTTALLVGVRQAARRACRLSLGRTALLGAFAGACLLLPGASALGAIDLGSGGAQPSIIYDAATGYTYVAWADPVSRDTVDLCVVPSGGSSCNGGSGPYKLTDTTASSGGSDPEFFGNKVLVMPGGTVVVVTNVEDANSAVLSPGYTGTSGVIAWSSPANGEAFGNAGQGIANAGKLLAEGRGEMPAQGALALNATSILTYGNQHPYASGATDFTLTGPALKETPLVDHTEEFGDQEFSDGSQVAAEEITAKPGEYLVVAAGSDGVTPKECPLGSELGTGYGVAKGTPAALQSQLAWGPTYFKVLTCVARAATLVTGGPGHAIGLVQVEGSGLNGSGEDGVYFRPFETPGDTFAAPALISQEGPFTLLGAEAISASEDSAGGLYALWGDSRGIELSYSDSEGSSWPAPVTALPEGADPVVAGVGGGSAEVAYYGNDGTGDQEYLQPVDYQALATPLPVVVGVSLPPQSPRSATATSTVQSGGGISGPSLTVPQGTAVSDQALISGAAAANAGGTVTYNLYKNNKCTAAAAPGSAESVVKGVAAPSAAVKPGAGTYYWQATYSGDAANAGSTSRCGGEVLVVALSAKALGLPPSKVCLSRRKFVVHPRAPKGVKLVSVEVQINGKFVKKGALNKHATSVSLVGLPKGTFKVALITTSSKGNIYEEVRTFHTCVPGKHKK